MAKVKIIERKVSEKETQYDYPVYLYFQGDDGDDEIVMVEENYQVRIKYDYLNISIEKSKGFMIEEVYLKHNLTTREHFMELYEDAMMCISNASKNNA